MWKILFTARQNCRVLAREDNKTENLKMCIDMDIIEKIKELKENLREEIDKEMRSLIRKFKDYVVVDHPDNSKYQMFLQQCPGMI